MKVSQKGKFYFVEDAKSVLGRFEDKAQAEQFAKKKENEMADFFRKTKVNMVVNSEEQLETRI
jgi:hypothetical protein